MTSDHGWDTLKHAVYLRTIVSLFQKAGIRVSLFIDPVLSMVEGSKAIGADRIELYTENYARYYQRGLRKEAIQPYLEAAVLARELELGVNAGHDLDLKNITFLTQTIPWIVEVSIGHALIAEALYLGLEKTIACYKKELLR